MQILLDDKRYRKLVDEAKRRGVSIGAVVRAAIDRLPDPAELEKRRAYLAEILAAEPIEVPDDPADLRRELDAAHDLFEY